MPNLAQDKNPRPNSSGASTSAAQQQGKQSVTDVSTECIDYRRMMANWQLTHDLMGGTATMRQAGSRWLPQEPKEDLASYLVRLNRSTFFNGYKRAVQSLAGRPFSKAVTYAEDLDDSLKDFILDVDLTGRHMDIFSRDLFVQGLADGIRHVLVDMSVKPADEKTVADEQRYQRRPYVVEIDPRNLTFWQYTYENGWPKLTEIRIRETVIEKDGDWGQKEITQYRVLMPGSFAIYRKGQDIPDKGEADKDLWFKTSEGFTGLQYIPLVTLYTGRTGFMQADPPLVDLAWENIHHWQSRSDQNHILHIARVPVWFGKGLQSITSEGRKIEYTISPNAMIVSSNDNADLKIVEHTGKAIEAGNKDLQDCENRMAVLGTELLVAKVSGNAMKTATEIDVEAQAQYSTLAMLVRGLEDVMETILEYMGDWIDVGVPDEEYVTLNKDFSVAGHIETVAALQQARTGGDLSQHTFLEELKRLGALSQTVNIDDEMDRISQEVPSGIANPEPGQGTRRPMKATSRRAVQISKIRHHHAVDLQAEAAVVGAENELHPGSVTAVPAVREKAVRIGL